MIKFLETSKAPASRKQIAEGTGIEPVEVSHTLAILLRWDEVGFIEYTGEDVKRLAGYSPGRRTRFFFSKK